MQRSPSLIIEDNRNPSLLQDNTHSSLIINDISEHQSAEPNQQLPGRIRSLFIAIDRNNHKAIKPLFFSSSDLFIQDEKGTSALRHARNKNLQLVLDEFYKCIVDQEYPNAATDLFWAILCNQDLTTITKLIAKITKINVAHRRDSAAPLIIATQENRLDIINLLLERKDIDIEVTTPSGATAAFIAAQQGCLEILKILVEKKAQVNVARNDGTTPLYIASQMGHTKIVTFLLENGADTKIACINGYTPLDVAAQHAHLEIIKLLIKNEVDINTKYPGDNTALHILAKNWNNKLEKIWNFLLKNNANINAENNAGNTPLHILIENNKFKAIPSLLAHTNININAKNADNTTPILLSLQNGYIDIFYLLLNTTNVDIHIAAKNGMTALHFAVLQREIKVINILLEKDMNINAVDHQDITPFFIAAQIGDIEIINLLIKAGADTNIARKSDKASPFFIATYNGYLEIVTLLLEKDKSQINLDAALFVAAQKGHLHITQELVEHGANVNVIDANGVTALYIAAEKGYFSLAKLLVEKNANPNIVSNDGRTPLFVAVENGYIRIVKLLLENGADINIIHKGVTLLQIAKKSGNQELVKFLKHSIYKQQLSEYINKTNARLTDPKKHYKTPTFTIFGRKLTFGAYSAEEKLEAITAYNENKSTENQRKILNNGNLKHIIHGLEKNRLLNKNSM